MSESKLTVPQVVALGAVASAVTVGAFYYAVVKPQNELRALTLAQLQQQAHHPQPHTASSHDLKHHHGMVHTPSSHDLRHHGMQHTASSHDLKNHHKTPHWRAPSLISLRATKDTNYWPDMTTMTPAQIFDFLIERNKQFVDGHFFVPDLSAKRRRTVADNGQFPPVAVVACADARVPPEYIFGAGVGDLFLVRAAGTSIDRLGLGSLEYAVSHLGIKLILVMGHSQCGAVTAAVKYAAKELQKQPYDKDAGASVERTTDNSIWSLVESCLVPAREALAEADPECSDSTNIEEAIGRNAKHQGNVIYTNSKILRKAIKERKVAIRCVRSFIRTGQVFEIPYRPVKDPRAVLAPPSPLFADPKTVVLDDD